MAVALSLSLEDARVCQPNRTSADDWACQQCTLINTSKIRCSACSAPAPTRQCRGKTKVPRPTAPPIDDSSGDDCGGSCLAGMFDFAGEPRCKPSADEPLGGWGYTACCGCAYHFQCLARHLNPHGKTVESTSGEVPLELKCPQCRTSLSRSSTRMLGGHDKVQQDLQAQQELNEQERIDDEQIVRDRAARSLARVLCGRALVKCEDQMTEFGFESFVVTDNVGQIEEVLAPTTEGCEVMLVVSWDGADAIRMALTDALPYLVGPIPPPCSPYLVAAGVAPGAATSGAAIVAPSVVAPVFFEWPGLKRKCGRCGELGHNRRTCALLHEVTSALERRGTGV